MLHTWSKWIYRFTLIITSVAWRSVRLECRIAFEIIVIVDLHVRLASGYKKFAHAYIMYRVFITVVAMANSMVYWASDPLILGNLIENFPALSIVEELAYLCFPSRKVTEIVFPDEDFWAEPLKVVVLFCCRTMLSITQLGKGRAVFPFSCGVFLLSWAYAGKQNEWQYQWESSSKHLNKFMKVERCYGASIAVSKLVFHVSDFWFVDKDAVFSRLDMRADACGWVSASVGDTLALIC